MYVCIYSRRCLFTWSMTTWEALMSFLYVTIFTMTYYISPSIICLLKQTKKVKFSTTTNKEKKVFGKKMTVFGKKKNINNTAWNIQINFWGELTSTPSGKHRQKKSGRGRPTAFLIESVMTPVISTANKRPALRFYISALAKYAGLKLKKYICLATHKQNVQLVTENGVVQIIDISPTQIDEEENNNRQQNRVHLIIKNQKNQSQHFP